MAKYRDLWLATARKLKSTGGQIRAFYMSGQAPILGDTTAENNALIAAGYPVEVIQRSSQLRAMPWHVLHTSKVLFARRDTRREVLPPQVGPGYVGLGSRFDRMYSTSAVKYSFGSTQGGAVTRSKFRAGRFLGKYGGVGATGTLDSETTADLLRAFYGDPGGAPNNFVTAGDTKYFVTDWLSPWNSKTRPEIFLGQFPERQGQTCLVTRVTGTVQSGGYEVSNCVYQCVYVPEIVPGLTHLLYTNSNNDTWPHGCTDSMFGISGGRGTPSAKEFIQRYITSRTIMMLPTDNTNVSMELQTDRFWWSDSTTVLDPSGITPSPYVTNQILGTVAQAGWLAGQCYFASQPEFCDSFVIAAESDMATATNTVTFAAAMQIGLSFPPEVLTAMRTMNDNAKAQTPVPDQRLYSWLATPTKVATGLLSRLRMFDLAKKADMDLTVEKFIDQPAAEGRPAMSLTFDETAKRAEGKMYSMTHYVEPADQDSIDRVVVSGTTGNLSIEAYSGGVQVQGFDGDDLLAYLLDGNTFVNSTVGSNGNPPPDDAAVTLALTGVTAQELASQLKSPMADFDLRRTFRGTWPVHTMLSAGGLAAAQMYAAAMDVRPLHQLAATSIAWSQIREAK